MGMVVYEVGVDHAPQVLHSSMAIPAEATARTRKSWASSAQGMRAAVVHSKSPER
jgi:hypothetical protein